MIYLINYINNPLCRCISESEEVMEYFLIGAIIIVLVLLSVILSTRKAQPNANTRAGKLINLSINLVVIVLVGYLVTTVNDNAQNGAQVNTPKEQKLQAELTKKEEMLAISLDKLKAAQLSSNQAKAETELHTSNILKLQEELLRRNDEFNLLKEELDLRYKIDASKILKENEDRIRKSASAEAQKILEKSQLEARIKVAKDSIESKIVSKWTPPKDKHNLTTVAKYTLDANGRVVTVDLVQRSGAVDVDNSVLDAIKAASPFELSKDEEVRAATTSMVSKFTLP